MGYKFNPFTGNFDTTDSPNGEFESLDVTGDINLDDGGTYVTTLQTVTPTADRTISFPDATGTVALVAGSNGQLVYNNAGSQAGLSTLTTDGTNITLSGQWTSTLNGAASAPPVSLTGTWFTGGTSTTTKPQLLIEPTGTTSTAWSTNGTGFGVNAPSGFTGVILDLQLNGASKYAFSTSALTLGDAVDLAFGTTTGTKIGTASTQKLAFWNATPVAQPTAVADATDAASVITQLNALLSRMRDLGLIAT